MNRSSLPNVALVMLQGFILGAIAYLASEYLVPVGLHSPGVHDYRLAKYLGYIFPPLIGLWLGWHFRSLKLGVLGVIVGLIVGAIYSFMCDLAYAMQDFFLIQVTFPCACGGIFAVLVASDSNRWASGIMARLIKGLVAGFVLGMVYMVVLSIGGMYILGVGVEHKVDTYVAMMWRVGPIALGTATSLFLPLLRWAVGHGSMPALMSANATQPTQTS